MTRRPAAPRRPALAPALFHALLAPALLPGAAAGQAGDAVRDEMMAHFEMSMQKFIGLARAMPAELYTWSPGEGVMEVGQVFMHVAAYNYGYPSGSMGVALPAGVALETMEAERDRAEVVRALEASRAWVREAVSGMSDAELMAETRLYGRTVPSWAVLVQLVAHMNEHLGQSIAYARMNGIVPPWSR